MTSSKPPHFVQRPKQRALRNRRHLSFATQAERFGPVLAELALLAEDTWLIARKSPALEADPALLAAANRLLADLRRLLARAPDARLPGEFAPGTRLHALAPALRLLHLTATRHAARHLPRSLDQDLDDASRLAGLYLRDMTLRVLDQRQVALPADIAKTVAKKVIPAPPPRP